jgi:endonuclease/exonuclease/phosphatase family metal-dependent hydrolase
MKLEEILNILFQNQVNLVICGDFNENFRTNNTKKYKITSLLGSYNLHYTVDFPTHISTYSASTIDNIFLDRSRNKNFITEPHYNGLSDHDALMLTLYNPSCKHLKPESVRIGRYYDDSSIREFK